MIKGMADAVVKSGMKDAGYVYVNIDDCWQVSRDANANIVADPQRFPHGMKAGGRLHSFAGTEVRRLFRRGFEDLRGTARRPRARVSGCRPVRGVGRRLFEIRLVQHDHTGCEGFVRQHPRRSRRCRAADRAEHLRVGHGQALAVGQGSWRELVAYHGRYQRPVGRPGEMAGRQLLLERRAGDYRSAGWTCSPMPGRATGTIRTCSKSATVE